MSRFFEVKYVDADWNGDLLQSDNEVFVYLVRDCQEFFLRARKQILTKYHKGDIDMETFVRFKIEAEAGSLKFYVSEDYKQLKIV